MELFLTHACNLRCTYCYNGRHLRRDMSPDVLSRAIDLAFADGSGPVGIAFFGGEPLLRFDSLREGVRLARAASARTGRPVAFRVTTNGTLLAGDRLAFLRDERFAVAVSLDGPADVQDAMRPGVGGRSSHDRVVRNVRAAAQAIPGLNVIAVVTPATADRAGDAVAHAASLGVRAIHLALDWHADWSTEDLRRLRRGLARAAGIWADSFRAGAPLGVTPFAGVVARAVLAGAAHMPRCACGDREWTVAPSGRIYPCDRMVGQDDGSGAIIGTVFDGFDGAARARFLTAKTRTPPRCARCPDAARCRFWAPCVREPSGGWDAAPSTRICRLERAMIGAVDRAATRLYDEGNRAFLDRFYRNATARTVASRHGMTLEEATP